MFVEIHMLQNVAPSNLNRDDTNSPKDCTFGGFRRARVSSQSWKRAIRTSPVFAAEVAQQVGVRTKLVHQDMVKSLVASGRSEPEAQARVLRALEAVGFTWDAEKERTAVLLFVAPAELEAWAKVVDVHWDLLGASAPPEDSKEEGAGDAKAKPKTKKAQKKDKADNLEAVVKDLKAAMKVGGAQAVDVALFGRMVAENTEMSRDAACQVAHAISTHAVQIEMDFYTAVDDLQPKEDTGAGMMGVVEFNSACFYRYALVDTAQLVANLGGDAALASDAVVGFFKAAVSAIPRGKQNSFAAQNPPDWIRVVVRNGGTPRSLVNAFEEPVRPSRSTASLVGESIARANVYALKLDAMLGEAPPTFVGTATTAEAAGKLSLPELWTAVRRALGTDALTPRG